MLFFQERAMNDFNKTKEQLIKDLEELRKRVNGLENDKIARRKAEEDLSIEKHFIENVINSLPGIFYLVDDEGNFHKWNRNAEIITGYSADEMAKIKTLDLFEGEDKKLIKEKIQEVFDKGESCAEADLISKSGKKTRYYFTGHRLAIDNKQYLVGMSIDIGELRKAEKALAFSEERFRILVENSPIGIYYSDFEGNIIYGNRKAEEIVGYKKEELIGKSFLKLDLLAPEDIMKAGKLLSLNKLGEATGPDEFTLNRKDGSTVNIEVICVIIIIKGENRILGMVQDITGRKKAVDALRESEEKYRSLIEALQEGIWVIDKHDKTTFVNKRMADMLGYAVDEMLGKRVLAFMDERGRELCKQYLERRKQGINEQHDFEFIKKDGNRLYVTMESSSIRDKDGNYISGVAGVIDITDRKYVEEALIKANKEIETWNNELEKRIKEKADELIKSQNQLIQAEKMSAMGQMAGGVVHELNSPLVGLTIMINKHLGKANEGSHEHKEFTDMLKAVDHMARVIQDFSLFSRKSKGEFKTLGLNEVIEDTLSFSATRLKQRGVKVIKELSDKVPLIRGNKTELQQVVLNMLTNACDAMPKGGSLIVKTDALQDRHMAVMKFIDNGIGIEKENLDKIFDPFFTTKKEGEGTGLGLSVSYGIIKKHGGGISVESEPGKGTKFSIYLPAVKSREL